MIMSKTKRWGNSVGLIIPKEELKKMNIAEGEEILVEITKKQSPLKELFGVGKNSKITKQEFQETRKILEDDV